ASLAALRAGGAATAPLGRALGEVLRAISDEQPVLVLVDDAQWVDRESLLALGAVARDLTQAPLFLVFTITAQPPRADLDALRVRIGRELLGAAVRLERSEEHTSELQSRFDLVCRLLLEKKNKNKT